MSKNALCLRLRAGKSTGCGAATNRSMTMSKKKAETKPRPPLEKDAVLAAEVVPTSENASCLQVVWMRRPFQRQSGPVVVDARRLRAA